MIMYVKGVASLVMNRQNYHPTLLFPQLYEAFQRLFTHCFHFTA